MVSTARVSGTQEMWCSIMFVACSQKESRMISRSVDGLTFAYCAFTFFSHTSVTSGSLNLV